MGLSRDQLLTYLDEQCQFLAASSAAFDHGNMAEAKRLATTIRVLVHDTKQSSSLLTQLNVKLTLRFATSLNEPISGNVTYVMDLVSMELSSSGLRYFAPLGNLDESRQVSFEEWWQEPVMRTPDEGDFSRRDYVLSLANKVGGAHIDPELSRKIDELVHRNVFGWEWFGSEGVPPPGSPVAAAVRQITHELLWTIRGVRQTL